MTAAAPPRESDSRSPRSAVRYFVGPLFDTLVIGAGLSLPVVGAVLLADRLPALAGLDRALDTVTSPAVLPWVILLCTGSHFAASTVRLYTKPGAVAKLPFLTLGFPLVAFGVLTVCLLRPGDLGSHLQALYFTWSPYHYAAQGFGLAVMYAMRAGCGLARDEKRLLRIVALSPFFYNFISTGVVGLHWFTPDAFTDLSAVKAAIAFARPVLSTVGLAGPIVLALWLARRSKRLPAISAVALIANAVWWTFLPPVQAFVWATFFHGIQYLAIAAIFHAREQSERPRNRHGRGYHAARFYAVSLLLAYGLFNCVPQAYVFAGFSLTESLLLVTAVINLHHFIVDGFIWRMGRDTGNRTIVESEFTLAPATS